MASNLLKGEGEKETRVLRSSLGTLKSRFGVRKIGIFGSVIRCEATSSSDIDILVDFEEGKATFRNFMDLIVFLEDLFGRRVDLVTTGGMDPYIRSFIEKEVVWC